MSANIENNWVFSTNQLALHSEGILHSKGIFSTYLISETLE